MEAPDSMLQPSSASTAGARLPVASQQSAPAGAYADIRVDPRTGLAIIDVPHEYRSDFSELEGSLIHYFSKVKRIGSRDKAQDRIMVISDSCIYLFLLTGLTTTRCIPIQDIQEVLYSRDNDIGFRLPETEQYDCMCLLSTNQERDTVLEIVRKIYTFFTGEALPVRRVDVSVIKQSLQLKMPKGWQVKLEPIQTKKLLAQQLQAQQQEDDSEQRILNEEFERIKGKLRSELELQVQQRNEEFAQFKREYQSLQEAHNNLVVQYDAMAQDVETYVKLLNEKDAELERYRSGDHPRFKELEHELEKVMYKKDLEEHKQRVTLQQQVESRDEQLRHKDELLRMKDQQYYSLQMSEQHLMEQVRQKDEEIVALEQALRDRDVLLQAKDSELQEKETRAAEKERELRYTKSLMRDAFRRQVEELEQIRLQFHQYDDQIVAYLEKVFNSDDIRNLPPPPPRQHFSIPSPMGGIGAFVAGAPSSTSQPPPRGKYSDVYEGSPW